MPYPEGIVAPMREELTRLGIREMRDAASVDDTFREVGQGTLLVVVNSVCGCAAANARPAISLAMHTPVLPDVVATVFAGQDTEATQRVRDLMPGIPPSSPSMALFKDGEPVYVIERRHIEGRSASAIAADLSQAFNRFCGTEDGAANGPDRPQVEEPTRHDDLPSTFRSIL